MRLVLYFVVILSLGACATTSPMDRSISRGPPSKFNENPEMYDRKVVYITGYLRTSGHWWNFSIGNGLRFRSGKTCLNIADSDTLDEFRENFDQLRVTLKGVYHKGIWASVFDGCENGHGIVLDEAFLRDRYAHLLRP